PGSRPAPAPAPPGAPQPVPFVEECPLRAPTGEVRDAPCPSCRHAPARRHRHHPGPGRLRRPPPHAAPASPRVGPGPAAVSWQGRPLRYAIVGRPGNVTPAGLARIRHQTALLRDPRTPRAVAAHLARTTPAILWVAGNVHGGEESGTDGALRVLYELADRRDCAAGQILDNAIVVLLPIQNPDGREADTRRNAYRFDLKRCSCRQT